jgi:hypothetical protein
MLVYLTVCQQQEQLLEDAANDMENIYSEEFLCLNSNNIS